jgi:purine-binding chemotaxis protein CheW
MGMQELESGSGAATATDQEQYLTFRLGGEEFGFDILRVQEIRGWTPVTPIPNAPAWLKGVMNLRGTVVPVVDLRLRFGMAKAEYTRFTVVVVVTIGDRVAGLVVDAVSDVLDVSRSDIVPPPDMGRQVDMALLTGLAKSNDRIISLLAIEPLLGALGEGSARA